MYFAHLVLLDFALVEKHLEEEQDKDNCALSDKCFEEKFTWEVRHYFKALAENQEL